MYIKLTKLHLFGIVILSLVLGALGLLGVKEAYENLQNPRHVHKDYMCSVVPKKIPKDTELRHYAATNDMEAARKRQDGSVEKKPVELAAGAVEGKVPEFLTKEEIECVGKLARNMGGEEYNKHQRDIKIYEETMADKTIEKKDKLMMVQLLRSIYEEKGCYAPRGASSESSINSSGSGKNAASTDSPDYQCLRISDKVTHSHSVNDPLNEERVGYLSPENHYRRGHQGGYHQHSEDKIKRDVDPRDRMPTHRRNLHRGQHTHKKDIPKGQEDLYILKSQIVPPVCPKCPEIPRTICDKCGKNSDSEVEDELKDNELEEEKTKSSSRAARRREQRRRTASNQPGQNSPGVAEAANRHSPNQTAFAPQSGQPIPRLNSFSAFG